MPRENRAIGDELSNHLLNRVWETDFGSPTAKLIMARLADRVDLEKSNDCWPSIQTICKDCCLSERAVQKHIRELKEKGFLEIKNGGGRHQVNHYVPFPDNTVHQKPRIRNPVSGAENGARRAENGARRAPQPKGTQKEPKGGTPHRRFEREIQKSIELKEKEMQTLWCRSALENSLLGTQWRNEDDKVKYYQLQKSIRADKDELAGIKE